MLLRLTKIQRKTIGIYVPILLRDLGCRPGGGSQKQGIDASRAVPVAGYSEVNPDSERIPTRRNTTKITVWPEGRTGVQGVVRRGWGLEIYLYPDAENRSS
jgi:hypothetical protein